jgi:hypothetical protein
VKPHSCLCGFSRAAGFKEVVGKFDVLAGTLHRVPVLQWVNPLDSSPVGLHHLSISLVHRKRCDAQVVDPVVQAISIDVVDTLSIWNGANDYFPNDSVRVIALAVQN